MIPMTASVQGTIRRPRARRTRYASRLASTKSLRSSSDRARAYVSQPCLRVSFPMSATSGPERLLPMKTMFGDRFRAKTGKRSATWFFRTTTST